MKASKYGLRKAAEERTARHAQRTPLPPRDGQIDDAKEAIALAKKAHKKASKERRREGRDEEQATAEALESAGRPAVVDAMAPKSPKSPSAKADDFIAAAAGSGWDVDHAFELTSVRTDIVTVRRGEEALTIEWQNGVFMPNCIYRRPDGSTMKIRNASHAKQVMASPAPTPEQLGARRAVRERMNGQGEARIPVRTLPFDMALLTDPELTEALRGCKLVWINSISGTEESDIVPPASRCYVDEGFSGRQIHFNSPVGARSVRISSIIHIGGSRLAQSYRRHKKEKAA